jgi:trehalose 6-phosphate synthase
MSAGSSAREGRPVGRLVVASNRLPLVLQRADHGEWEADSASGGLVTALDPVLRDRQGIWVGWPGGGDDVEPDELEAALEDATREHGYQVQAVPLTAEERDGFYLGFSNQVIWPLFHDFPTRCNFDPRFWDAYVAVNRKFAAAIAEVAGPDDFVWVHDYHLMGVASELRGRRSAGRLGFFLHIPFPHLDLFANLPWRFEILDSLLRFDLVGFQTDRDRSNFLQCVETLMPGVERRRRIPSFGVWTASVATSRTSASCSASIVSTTRRGSCTSCTATVSPSSAMRSYVAT